MLKKIIIGILALAIFYMPSQTKAEETVIDQACMSETGSYFKINLAYHDVWQIFTPTKNTLDSAYLGLESGSENPNAKALVRVTNVTDPQNASLIAQKYISVGIKGYYFADFDNVPMPSGIYALSVQMLHANEPINWIATGGECYSGGYAVIDGTNQNTIDTSFSVNGYNSSSSGPIDQPAGNAPSAPNSSSLATSQGGEGNLPAGIEKTSTNPLAGSKIPGNAADANKESAYRQKLADNKELQEQIAFLMKDIEENKYKDGAFGLSGRVGRILTWPVFYGICALLLLIMIILIVRSVRKKRALAKQEDKGQST